MAVGGWSRRGRPGRRQKKKKEKEKKEKRNKSKRVKQKRVVQSCKIETGLVYCSIDTRLDRCCWSAFDM